MKTNRVTPSRLVTVSLALLAALCVTTLTGSTPTPQAADTSESTLRWGACSDQQALPAPLECATLQAPLDWTQPGGETITLGLTRLRATDPEKRIGTLIFEPGGPGGAGSEYVALNAQGKGIFTERIRTYFDIVGFDPRGVGTSTPVRCDPKVWNEAPSQFPESDEAFAELVAYNKAAGESCLELTGPLLAHVDTASVAQDLEAVRAALGEGKLNYLGLSYGTQIGAQYAALYPDNIRVMALDGVLDHSLPETYFNFTASVTVEDSFERFARWCDETPECALHGKDVGAFVDALVAKADTAPLPAPLCQKAGVCKSKVTGEMVFQNLQGQLLFKEPLPALGFRGWIGLAQILADADAGDASYLSGEIFSSDTDETYAALAITCLDWTASAQSYHDLVYKQRLAESVAPHIRNDAASWAIQANCPGWPVPMNNPPQRLTIKNTPPILLVNANHDPSTAFAWANNVLGQFDNAVLLTRDGDGHTSYLLSGESQTRDAIDEYLITGQMPPPNTVLPN